MQILQQVVELLRGSKSMIEHHVSHMSITDELLEERMKRATIRLPYAVFLLSAQLLLKCIDGLRGGQLLNTISQGIVSSPRFACASRVHLFCVYAASRSKIIGRNHGFWMLCLSFFTCCATFASKPWVTPFMIPP